MNFKATFSGLISARCALTAKETAAISSGDNGSSGCLEGGLDLFAETTVVAVDGMTVVEVGTGDILVAQ